MTQFLAICQNTFIQSIRQSVFGVLLIVTFAVLVLAVPMSDRAMSGSADYHETNQKLLESSSLTLLVTGLFVAAFSAAGALSREIDDKTALTVISKPVGRTTFLMGKFAGVSAAVALFYYLGAMAYLMCLRHGVMPAAADPFDWPVIVLGCGALGMALLIAMAGNYLFSWTFTSTAVFSATICMTISMLLIAFIGKGWRIVEFGFQLRSQLLVGLVMLFMAVLIFVAIAVAASTRLSQVMALLICYGVFFAGSVYPALFGKWNDQIVLSQILSRICPDLDAFYPIDALTMDKHIPMRLVALAGAYCACICAGVMAIGAAMFHHRQLEGQTASASMPSMVSVLAWIGRISAIVVALIGIEVSLSVWAVNWSPTFKPIFLDAFRNIVASPESSNAMAFIPAAGLIVLGAGLWVLWGFFGRGVRWSYYLVLLFTVVKLLHAGVVIFGLLPATRLDASPLPTMRAALCIAVLVVLFLPKTRRHFQSS